MNVVPHVCRLLITLLALATSVGANAAVKLDYWLWDASQLPAYRAAADAFEKANPDIQINITQMFWTDYWISLTTAFLSESGPDVFTNHPAKYPEFAVNGTLLDLAPLVARDHFDATRYLAGLYAAWGQGARQFGLPKDWDAVALVYNRAMLERAGVAPTDLENLDWNPRDGGSFGRVLARLTLDRAGENATSPRFDARAVRQYGLLVDGRPDGVGQLEWSHFAASTGFVCQDGPWSTQFHYDDPRLAATLGWLREAQRTGLIVLGARARQIDASGLFAAEQGALTLTGSWMINWFSRSVKFPFGFAPLPKGPLGRRTMVNGLADSIWAGTRHPEEAWRWVKFLGSTEGQMIVARHGVVFPADRAASAEAARVMSQRANGVGVFLAEATTPGGTFSFPVASHGRELQELGTAAMDAIFLQEADITAVLQQLQRDIERVFAAPE